MLAGWKALGLRFGRRRITEVGETLNAIRAGDTDARNQLIEDYVPFVLKVASQATGHYLRPGQDEEISVALLAFNEAIDAYSSKKGAFLSFAQTVIRRRLIDYYRRQLPRQQESSLNAADNSQDDEGPTPSALEKMARVSWQSQQDNENRRLEIDDLAQQLQRFGLSIPQLVKVSPKHQDSRDRAIRIGQFIAEQAAYRRSLFEKGELPMKDLVNDLGLSRKTLERHRKYIIAVAIIFSQDFPYLQEYLLER